MYEHSKGCYTLLYIQWWYATTSRHGRLVDENLDPIIKTTSSRRLLFGIIVYLIAIGISFVYIQLSVFLVAIITIPAFLPNKLMHRITFGTSHEKIRWKDMMERRQLKSLKLQIFEDLEEQRN